MTRVIDKDELPCSKVAHKFEGHRYGEVDVSFFLVDCPPVAARCCTPILTRRSS
jgi:hypothetical protein